MNQPTLSARIALWCGGFAFVAAVVGPLFAHFGIVPPLVGLVILGLGLLDALIAVAAGTFAVLRGGEASRGAAFGGLIAAVLALVPVSIVANRGLGQPGDITTDPANPPQFTQASRLDENEGRDLSYSGDSAASYGEIAPLRVGMEPGAAFAHVLAVANGIDTWEITLADPGIRKIEGVDTTSVLGAIRVQEDFVIEVRPAEGGGSLIHMRSKSREGSSDFGTNAERIRSFLERVASTPSSVPQ